MLRTFNTYRRRYRERVVGIVYLERKPRPPWKALSVVLGLAPALASTPLPAASNQIAGLSPQQQDRVIIDSLLQTDAPYKLGAIAYAVWGAGAAYDRDPQRQVEYWNPTVPQQFLLSGANPFYSKQTRNQFIERAAAQQDTALEGLQLKGTVGESLITAALGLLAPELGAAAPVVLPIVKPSVVNVLEVDPATPGISEDVARHYSLWALEQIRLGTDNGRILEPFITKWGIPNPRRDRSNVDAVQRAQQYAQTLRNSADLKQLLNENERIKAFASQSFGSTRPFFQTAGST
jgi:hypothetical protein